VRRASWILAVGALIVTVACGVAEQGTDARGDAAAAAVTAHHQVEVSWATSWDAAFERAREESKPVLVTFSADWCVWCKRLETTTFTDAKVAGLLADEVVPLELDVDGAGRELSNRFEIDPLPTVVVLASDGTELGRIVGYEPPASFLESVRGLLRTS
jgi:thioredoxin 1